MSIRLAHHGLLHRLSHGVNWRLVLFDNFLDHHLFDDFLLNLLDLVVLAASAVPAADEGAAQSHDDRADDGSERSATSSSTAYIDIILVVAVSPSVEVVAVPIVVGQAVVVGVVPESVVVVGREVVHSESDIGSAVSQVGVISNSSGRESCGSGDLSRDSSGSLFGSNVPCGFSSVGGSGSSGRSVR